MSEFGYGLVVPLVRFTEHMAAGPWLKEVELAIQWQKMTPIERQRVLEAEPEKWSRIIVRLDSDDEITVVAEFINMWSHGASDHIVGIDRSMAPQSLLDLYELLLELRHMQRAGNADDWAEIKRLWRQSTIDLDEMLGTDPEWG